MMICHWKKNGSHLENYAQVKIKVDNHKEHLSSNLTENIFQHFLQPLPTSIASYPQKVCAEVFSQRGEHGINQTHDNYEHVFLVIQTLQALVSWLVNGGGYFCGLYASLRTRRALMSSLSCLYFLRLMRIYDPRSGPQRSTESFLAAKRSVIKFHVRKKTF